MRKAPESERARMWREFYAETDPNNITPENEALNQYFSRIAQANQRFTDEGIARVAHRPRRGVRQPRPAGRGGREQPGDDRQPDRPVVATSTSAWSCSSATRAASGACGCCRAAGRTTSGPWRGCGGRRLKRGGGGGGGPPAALHRLAHPARSSPFRLIFPHAQPHPPAALPDRRLRPDLSRLLRDDRPAAPDHQGREHLRRLGRGEFSPPPAREVPPRLRRLGQRCRHLLPRGALPRVQVHPREARRFAPGRLRPRGRADLRAARGASGSRSWPSPATRPTTSSAPWLRPGAAARAPLGHRLGRQGLLSAHRPGHHPAQSGPRRPGGGGRGLGRRVQCRRAARRAAARRWWTSSPSSATPPTTSPA